MECSEDGTWADLPQIIDEAQPSPPTSTFSYSKSPQRLTSFLVLMLWISLGMEVLSIMSDLGQLALLSGTFTGAEAASNDLRQGIIGFGYIGVFIVTGITFLRWIYRFNYNCRGFGASDMRFTPGWSIGHFFIPFLNLVRPYQVMREILQVSQNPNEWKSQPVGLLVDRWWALFLVTSFLGRIVFRLSVNAESMDELRTSTWAAILAACVEIASCLAALSLVKTIARRQEALIARDGNVVA